MGGRLHPIAYDSGTPSRAETNYTATKQESLAIVWTLKQFKDKITDHLLVVVLFRSRNPNAKCARWSLTIQDFSPTLEYIAGKQNVVACIFPICSPSTEHSALDLEGIKQEQLNDPLWPPITKYL